MKPRKRHKCEEAHFCTCSIIADEPDEYCPIHGGCYVKPTCIHCGRFMKNRKPAVEAWLKGQQ